MYIKFFTAFWMLMFAFNAYGYDICLPTLTAAEVAYTVGTDVSKDPLYWAVGTGCVGENTGADVATMCTQTVVGGIAFCAAGGYSDSYSPPTSHGAVYGDCWCIRTHGMVDGALVESRGVGIITRLASSNVYHATCMANCAKWCAETVVNNTNGLRAAIMYLKVTE